MNQLCVHTITTKPWPIETAIERFAAHGVAGMTVWRDALSGRAESTWAATGQCIRDAGLEVVSLCRGGFFPAETHLARQVAIDDNRRAIDEATALGAPLVVLVCGALPGQPLAVSRAQIRDGIEAVLPQAQAAGVKLGVEPLHPMYADNRSAINTLAQANDICAQIDSPFVGVVVDVYHLWWDPSLQLEIRRCGQMGKLFAFHICDWRTPTEDLLNDRELMGEGSINIDEIRGWVEDTGFDGYNEVEIFSNRYWAMDQEQFLARIVAAYKMTTAVESRTST